MTRKRTRTHAFSRREFIRLSAVTTAGAVAVACGGGGEPEAEEPAPAAEAPAAEAADEAMDMGTYKEAPMLADMVSSGTLPPVDERLPSNPGVMPNAGGSNGNYGGVMRRGFRGVSDRWGPTKMQDRGLGWYDQDLNVQPRLAESWTINDDATAWTFNLREGAKWSDGAPFTSADLLWWYEHDLLNTDINPSVHPRWQSGGETMGLNAGDDYSATYTFNEPKPLFIYETLRTTRRSYLPGH